MSHESFPQGPPINSEMVTRHPAFEGDARQDEQDLSALVGDAIHDPQARGYARVVTKVPNGRFGGEIDTTYEVAPEQVADPNTESPRMRVTIRKSVTQGLDYQEYGRPGSIDFVVDASGQVLHAYSESVTGGYNSPIEKHELTPKDAKNAASEAIAVIRAQNAERERLVQAS